MKTNITNNKRCCISWKSYVDELVAKGDAALTDLLNEHPSADRQQLRNLIRAAQKEKEQNKPSKAYREIYQILKTLILED